MSTTGADPGREHALVLLAGTPTSSTGETIDRDNPFTGPARGWYLPAGTSTAFTAVAPIAYVSSPLPPGTPPTGRAPVLLGGPGAVVEVRGHGSWEREVTTLITPPLSVRLQLGETLARDGRWSTYPPHLHDPSNPPHETAVQEAFAFHLNPPTGFAVLLTYDDDHQAADATATVITDRSLAAVDHGQGEMKNGLRRGGPGRRPCPGKWPGPRRCCPDAGAPARSRRGGGYIRDHVVAQGHVVEAIRGHDRWPPAPAGCS